MLRSIEVRVYLRIILHHVSMTVLLSPRRVTGKQLKMFSQETVHRNRINAAREKVLKSHQMLNYSDIYFCLFIYLFILSRTCRYSEAINARQR